MQYRKLGNTDLNLSVIGFGAWAIGGGDWIWGWGPQDDAQSIATIKAGLDAGINWIDTAAAYGLGRSEKLISQAIAGRRDKVIIATKCGMRWDEERNISNNLQPESIRYEVEMSLKRLNTDVIDLMQIHWPDPNVPLEDSWGTLADLVQEGKLRAIGVSNYNVAQMEVLQAIHPIASLQPPYSLIERIIENAEIPFCEKNHIGVVAYSPMQSGLLTDNFDLNKVAENDWRRREKSAEELAKAQSFVANMKPIAQAAGKTVAQLAIAWVIAQPGISSAIVGARRPEQVIENVAAGDWVLNDEELAALAAM